MEEKIRVFLDSLGNLLDLDSEVRGGAVLVGATLAAVSVVGMVKRRFWPDKNNSRAKVWMDLPAGQKADLHIGDSEENSAS